MPPLVPQDRQPRAAARSTQAADNRRVPPPAYISRRFREAAPLVAIISSIPLVLIAFHATSRWDVTIDLAGSILAGVGAALLERASTTNSTAKRSATYPKPRPRSADRGIRGAHRRRSHLRAGFQRRAN
jgi:hypothetical protein